MAKIINLVQGSPEWKQWRKWKIGASMAPVIMGVSPFQTKLQLWESIVFGTEKEANYAMQRGTRLEDSARRLFNCKYNCDISTYPSYEPICLEHEDIPWMIASLDGAILLSWIGGNEVKLACEIKCPGKEAHAMAVNGEVPTYYMPQLQHQMVVANLKTIKYVSFDGENLAVVDVARDNEYISQKLMPELARFHQSIIDFKSPEYSDKDVMEIIDPKAIRDAIEYARLSKSIEDLKAVQNEYRENLLEYTKDHGRVSINGLKITKVIRKGNVDYSRIPELKNVKLENYRGEPIISWRIT